MGGRTTRISVSTPYLKILDDGSILTFIVHFRYGLECLFRFFSYGLEAKFRPELYKDFQTETLKDCQVGQLYGLEKFWAFTKYYKHAEELHIQPQLKDKLEPFKSIEDFKVLYKVILK